MLAPRLALVGTLALVALALAGCGGGSSDILPAAEAGPTLHAPSPVEQQLADELFARISALRTAMQVAPVARDPASDELAYAHADDMIQRGFVGHTNPDGMTVKDRIEAGGLSWTRFGQLIAFDLPTAQETLDSWVLLEDQRVVLLEDFAGAGIGVVEIAPGSYSWVVLFRTP